MPAGSNADNKHSSNLPGTVCATYRKHKTKGEHAPPAIHESPSDSACRGRNATTLPHGQAAEAEGTFQDSTYVTPRSGAQRPKAVQQCVIGSYRYRTGSVTRKQFGWMADQCGRGTTIRRSSMVQERRRTSPRETERERLAGIRKDLETGEARLLDILRVDPDRMALRSARRVMRVDFSPVASQDAKQEP